MLTIYSKNHCPFCDQAKALLQRKNIAFEEIKIDESPEARQFVMEAGHRTVPQIYKDGKVFVEGGYSGLSKLTDADFKKLLEG